MHGLFSDMRRTAMGAGILLLLALLFAEPGGVGGSAVGQDTAVAGAAKAERSADSAWFNAAEEEPAPESPPPPAPGGQDEPAAGVIIPPGPTGPDFPPGLRAPR